MIGKRWKEKQKKETVKIFKECRGILTVLYPVWACGDPKSCRGELSYYRAVCLEVYFRIPAFSYTYLYHTLYLISYITQRDLYFTILLLLWYACGKKYTNF